MSVVIGGINLLAAGQYGEIEAWLSMVKIIAIIAFLAVGVFLVARTVFVGPLPGHEGVLQNILGHSGFAPTGVSGIAVALLAVITSFGGLEIVTIAAAEAEDPRAAIGERDPLGRHPHPRVLRRLRHPADRAAAVG